MKEEEEMISEAPPKAATFLDYPATKKLQELAKNPIDLTKVGTLTPQRVKSFRVDGPSLSILYATERVNGETIDALYQLAAEANVYDWMAKMQGGEVINKINGVESENRSVLHTAMRDFFEQPNSSVLAKEATRLAKLELDKLENFVKATPNFTDIVLVGIGGSDLGPEAIYLSLEKYQKPGRRAHFISNVDPDNAAKVFGGLDLKKTLVVVISKSGTTLETVTNEQLARSYFEKAGLDCKNHFLSVTGQGSPMDDKSRYLESFYIWDFIGGRYSATSMVGGVLLAFTLGFDNYLELLRGAQQMDKNALTKDPKKNLPLNLALLSLWNHNFLGCPTTVIIPYSQALSRFPAHIQQLDMESNGKHIDRQGKRVSFQTGPIIWGEPGTNAQHSFFQLIHQGTAIVPMEMIGFMNSQYGEDLNVQGTTSQQKLLSNLIAQAIALATGQKSDNPNKGFEGNRPSLQIIGKELTPYTMGALFSLYENKVAFQGFIWGINSFDQEGVQLGKVLATKVLNLFGGAKREEYPLGAAYIDELN